LTCNLQVNVELYFLVFTLFILSFADMLSTCQLTRTAQIYLELHLGVELRIKKTLMLRTMQVVQKPCMTFDSAGLTLSLSTPMYFSSFSIDIWH